MNPRETFEAHGMSNDMLEVRGRDSKRPTDEVSISVRHRGYGGGRSILLSRAQVRDFAAWVNRWVAEGWDETPHTEGPTPGDIIRHFQDIATQEQIRADRECADAARQVDAALALIPAEHRSADLGAVARAQSELWHRLRTEADQLEDLRQAWVSALVDIEQSKTPDADVLRRFAGKAIRAQDRILMSRNGKKPTSPAGDAPIYDAAQLDFFGQAGAA